MVVLVVVDLLVSFGISCFLMWVAARNGGGCAVGCLRYLVTMLIVLVSSVYIDVVCLGI